MSSSFGQVFRISTWGESHGTGVGVVIDGCPSLVPVTEEDIQRIAKTYNDFQAGVLEDEKGYCAAATLDEVAKQDYILTPGRYVGIAEAEDDGEPFLEKMERLTSELSEMFEKSHQLEEEIRKQLGSIGFKI